MALALLLTSYPAAAQVTLAWDASLSMVDGYWLYYGMQSGIYTTRIDVGTATTSSLAGLISGETYYFAVTAYDNTEHVESAFSNEVSTTLPPNRPPVANAGPGGGGGGCTINPGGGFDPLVMGIIVPWLASFVWKRATDPDF